MYELINGTPMPIREYNGQRVLTLGDIDNAHERPDGTARRNFNTNRKHFIEGVDFFKITPYEFRTAFLGEMDTRQQNDIILVTLSGYLMISKSFKDDLSWGVQRRLVTYFIENQTSGTYLELLYRYNELESRLNQLESKLSENTFRLPEKSSLQTRQENAAYVMEKLYKSGETIFNKHQALILCRPMRAKELTEVLQFLAKNGYISYRKLKRTGGGKPKEIIKILKSK